MMDSHKSNNKDNCKVVTNQTANVSVPITVKPTVNTGEISTFCCGQPTLRPSSCSVKCYNKSINSCTYVISQNICIEVPIEFSANAFVHPPSVICGDIIKAEGSSE